MKGSILFDRHYRISYANYGDRNGFPILIQHGLIASIDDYDLFNRLIRCGARLICIARPGYGASSPYILANIAEWADFAAAVIDKLQVQQFDILGMSSGAPYSYALGHRFPDKVRNIYIFSGIPALYDRQVQLNSPFPITANAGIEQMEALAYDLFFSNVSSEALERNDIKATMSNNCFGIALDLILRSSDWGFKLSDLQPNVYMQHSRWDQNIPLITAQLTAKMLSHCELTVKESDEHFSPQALDEFIESVMLRKIESEPKIFHR